MVTATQPVYGYLLDAMIKAVIIDLDDTLTMTELVSFKMENEILGHLGRKPMDRITHLESWGMPLEEALPLRSPGVDIEEFKKFYSSTINKYLKSGELDVVSPENLETLDKLIKQGKLVAILTSRNHQELKHLMAPDHLLSKSVKAFYYRDNMRFHKPDPRAFTELLKDNNLNPKNCVYIGDSISDGIASLESGSKTKSDFKGIPVDSFITAFPQIEDIIWQLDNM